MKTIRLFTLLSAVSALAACSSSDKVDIGDNSPPASLGSKLSDYTGSWSGYAEAFQFADLSDHVRLVLDEHGEGTLEVGEDGPAPALDLDLGPPSTARGLLPAYSYTLASSSVTDKRLKIAAQSWEPDVPYCAAFTPIYDSFNDNGHYSCMPNLPYRSEDETHCFFTPGGAPEIPFDCRQDLCRRACSCTETACTSNASVDDIKIDAALSDANTLVGTLIVPDGRVTIRLEKD